MKRFQASPIISVTGAKSRFNLGQSYGPNLRLGDFLTSDALQNLAYFELGYEHPQGNVRLRETIARSYEADAEDVVVTTGAMHAIFLLAFALCDRGDEVVMTSPQFPPTLDALESVGANVRTLRLSFDDRYEFDPVAFGRLLSAKTRLVVLTSPQNPSGIFIPQEQITALLEIVQERSSDAFVVVDETYREASFGENALAASSLSLHPRVAVIASLSKCHGAPGLRIGWMITQDHALREQLILAKFHSAVACGALDEAIAVRLLEQQGRILNERRASLAQCLAKTEEFVADHQRYLEWVRPDSGALCCMRLRSSMYDDDAVERFYQALETRGVLVSKGVWFGEAANVFRVGFGHGTIEELTEAYGELGRALMEAATVGIATS